MRLFLAIDESKMGIGNASKAKRMKNMKKKKSRCLKVSKIALSLHQV